MTEASLREDAFTKRAVWALLIVGTLLRLALYVGNPGANSFDNHFEPVYLLMENWSIPAKGECWQCYHPPLFYMISALWGSLVTALGAGPAALEKALQFLPALYGIVTLPFIYATVKRLPLSNFSRVAALGVAALLPRHIYMSAMHTNDTLSCLLVTIAVYLTLRAIDEKFAPKTLVLLSLVMGLALLTKITTLVLLPAVGVLFLAAFIWKVARTRRDLFIISVLVFIFPILVLAFQAGTNIRDYGKPFPINYDFRSPGGVAGGGFVITSLPGEGNVEFLNFKPISAIKAPIVGPETVGSFWTLVYSRMWWDMKPKFLYLAGANAGDTAWWYDYYDYLHGKHEWPGLKGISRPTLLIGSLLLAMALVPTFLMVVGFFNSITGGRGLQTKENKRAVSAKLFIFPVLALFNIAGVVQAARSFPIFSSMKAAYFLNSTTAMVLFFALGVEFLFKGRSSRRLLGVYLALFFLLIALHIVYFASGPIFSPLE